MSSNADRTAFFKAWAADPLRVGSVVPFGHRLATAITRSIDPAVGLVLELGPGTGVFTQAMIGRGIRQEDLTLVESGEAFATILRERFPAIRILRQDAARLWRLRSELPKHAAAVSGLPLLSMPPSKVLRILRGAFAVLDAEASLYQFTYGWKCPVSPPVLDRLGLRAEKVATILANVPPASVYKFMRRGNVDR